MFATRNFLLVALLVAFCFLLPHAQSLRHYGYYGATVGELLDDPSSPLSSQINTIFVSHTWGPYAANLTALGIADSVDMATAARSNLSVILELTRVCWTPVGAHWALRPDWEARWETYWGIVSKSAGIGSLIALYPVDEPNGSEKLGVVTPRLRATVDVPIIAVLAQGWVLAMEAGTYELPHEIDWLGFDAYNCWDSCYQGHSIPDYLRMIEKAVSARANRSIVVVPDAMSALVNGSAAVPPLAVQQAKLASAEKYEAYCNKGGQESSCVAILPFLWKTVLSCCGGLETLPLLQPYYQELGARIKNHTL